MPSVHREVENNAVVVAVRVDARARRRNVAKKPDAAAVNRLAAAARVNNRNPGKGSRLHRNKVAGPRVSGNNRSNARKKDARVAAVAGVAGVAVVAVVAIRGVPMRPQNPVQLRTAIPQPSPARVTGMVTKPVRSRPSKEHLNNRYSKVASQHDRKMETHLARLPATRQKGPARILPSRSRMR